MTKLVWRVKLVAELRPGMTSETEAARIECEDELGLAELRLDDAERLTAALRAKILVAQTIVAGDWNGRFGPVLVSI